MKIKTVWFRNKTQRLLKEFTQGKKKIKLTNTPRMFFFPVTVGIPRSGNENLPILIVQSDHNTDTTSNHVRLCPGKTGSLIKLI